MTVLLTFYIFLIVISDLSYSCMPQSSNVIQKETYGRIIRGFFNGHNRSFRNSFTNKGNHFDTLMLQRCESDGWESVDLVF